MRGRSFPSLPWEAAASFYLWKEGNVTLPKKCHRGNKCIVHGFHETASKLLVKRAFDLMAVQIFTPEEMLSLRQVANGKR